VFVAVRPVLALLTSAVLVAGLASCGTSDSDASSARPGGAVTVYSGRSETLVKPVFDQFTKKTGIKVNTRYGETAAMATQLLEEGDKTKADLFLAQDAGALGAVSRKGLFAELPESVQAKVPAAYRAKDGRWVGVTGRSRVLVYNVDKVKAADLPKSVFDLTGPAWKGKVGIAPTNGSFQAFVTGMRVTSGEQRTAEFLKGLKANDVQLREKNGAIVEDVHKGTLAAGLVNHYYVYEKAAEVGGVEKVKAKLHFFAGGDPGGLVNVSGLGVLKSAARDSDVRKLVDYLLGTEGQTYFSEEAFEYPLIAGVEPAPGLPKLDELDQPKINLDDLQTLEKTVGMIKAAGLA